MLQGLACHCASQYPTHSVILLYLLLRRPDRCVSQHPIDSGYTQIFTSFGAFAALKASLSLYMYYY